MGRENITESGDKRCMNDYLDDMGRAMDRIISELDKYLDKYLDKKEKSDERKN